MLASFLIFLREGIEGSLIVTILLTYLSAGGRRELMRWVYAGAATAIAGSGLFGGVAYALVKDSFVGSGTQTWFETATFAVAVGVLTYMTFWMKRHSRTMAREIRERADQAVHTGSGWALFTVAFVTVGREAVETAIFLLAIALQTTPAGVGYGAALGLGGAMLLAFAIYKLGVRLNFGRFFMVVGAGLMIVAAGLLANVVQNLQQLGVLEKVPGAALHVWNTGGLIAEESPLGDILHGLVGYAASPTALQLLVYVAFLAIGLAFFLRRPAATQRA